ncbi:dolichyl-diphosphooligosaccharide-protein glycotransferase [Amanita rubescens]|nr:dolichyl-diphosphooligosaccharide-protein glycotransferase [Amanita rubescens]
MLRVLFALLAVPLAFAAAAADHRKLVDLAAAGNGVINLDSNTYDLVTAPDRNWSVAIQLTALDPKRRCAPCRQFDSTWKAVAAAWTKTPKEQRNYHFFATLDFDNGHTVFQKLGLTSAPVVYVYPPAEGPRVPAGGKTAPSKYDFPHGFEAKPLAEYISKHTPVPIPYREPIDWSRYLTFAVSSLSVLLVLRYIAPVLQNRWAWAVVTILTCLVMTSGFMFTRIRNAPYTGGDGNWIAGGYSNQFGQEVHVLAFIYGLLGVAFLMLTVVIPNQASPSRQRIQIYLWTVVIMIVYSILVSLFRVKNRGYPFKLFL